MKKEINIFIFRRDFRIVDNTTLNKLANYNQIPIMGIFIFNHSQLTSSYASPKSISFMVGSLFSLNAYIHLFYDDDIAILTLLSQQYDINTIAFNRDCTPFSRKRDENIINWCNKKKYNMIIDDDYYLLPMDREWRVFTPYYKHCLSELERLNKKANFGKPKNAKINFIKPNQKLKPEISNLIASKSNVSRKDALLILKKIKENHFADYDKNRDYMYLNATTRLSAFIKFGLISIREVYFVVVNIHGLTHGIIRELLWRDYYARIVWFNPRVLQGQSLKNYELDWKNNYFIHWSEGRTGFPIVDAAMRELNNTGYMHNRCRMIVASFLVKDLNCDWRLGEKYFASHLIDYDPSSNSGGWQGISSVGADASQPYFRIMNPWRQSKNYDSECIYIKHWIPELKNIEPKKIHCWFKYFDTTIYLQPIINHDEASKNYLSLYKNAKK